jgi:hypothetical protein
MVVFLEVGKDNDAEVYVIESEAMQSGWQVATPTGSRKARSDDRRSAWPTADLTRMPGWAFVLIRRTAADRSHPARHARDDACRDPL